MLRSLSDEAFTQNGLILVAPSRVPKARNVLRAHGIAEEFATCATTPRRLNVLRRFRSAFKLAFAIPFTYKLHPE